MYTLQILKWYGYTNLAVVASSKHAARLTGYGAREIFDYRDGDAVHQINQFQEQKTGNTGIRYVLDSIGSLKGSVMPIADFARQGAKVAVILPIIVQDAAEHVMPIYEMDVRKDVEWGAGVNAVGIRTHFYLDNSFLADKLQTEIMPGVLKQKLIEPNEAVIVEGQGVLERVQKAVDMLRNKEASGARLVWRVAEENEAREILRV